MIANHTSNWDPFVLGFVIKHRPVRYMAKEELYKNKFFKWLLLALYTIPLARGKSDAHAIKEAVRALQDGSLLGIFPEGTRSKDKTLKPFQPGASLLALKAKVPVIPVYIKGGYRPFRKVTVFIGEPVYIYEIIGDKTTGKNIRAGADILFTKLKEMTIQYG